MIDPDNTDFSLDNKITANFSKNKFLCNDSVQITSPADLNMRTDEVDDDIILMGTLKGLEYYKTSINSTSQVIEDKSQKRKASRLSFRYVGSLFNKLVQKVSHEASDLRYKNYENLRPESLELGPIIEQMLSQKVISPHYLPGVVGLLNQSNTCYMNAVLQCLSNTDQLTAFILSDHYRTCLKLNQNNRGRFSNISTFAHSTTTLNSGHEHVYGQELSKKSFSRSRGLVTEHLACLFRNMWLGRSCSESLNRFKNLAGRMGKQFKGSTQQDAHEFLLWLLDQLHEDLSINVDATKRKSPKNKNYKKGNSSLEDYSTVGSAFSCLPCQLNQSAILDLFQAHYRSSLTCLKCGHKSHTFDPFLSISLSILTSSSLSLGLKHPIYVVVVYLNATPKQVRIGLQMKQGCTIKDLRETISNDTNIPREQLVLADVRLDGHVTTLFDNQPIENFRNLSSIYAIEIPKSGQVENHIVMVIVNKFENGVQYEKFGDPVVLLMHESSSFFDMQQDLFIEIKQHMLVGLNNYFFSKSFLDLRLTNFENRSECYYMSSSDSFPLKSSAVLRALDRCMSGPKHIIVIAEWYQMMRDNFSQSMNDSCVEHESVNVVRLAHCSSSCSLEDCFHVYTQKEQLGADNAWYCPSCNKKQVETLKTLTLWSLPAILVVHLKRFRHDSKLDTFVTFPIRDLDLSEYLSSKNIPETIALDEQVTLKNNCGVQESSDTTSSQDLKHPYKIMKVSDTVGTESTSTLVDCPPIIMKSIPNDKFSFPKSNHATSRISSDNSSQVEIKTNQANQSPPTINLHPDKESSNISQKDSHLNQDLYDLYAVCNHYGNLHDGHYTANCRNPLNNKWYLLNDTQVCPIKEEDVITKNAYLLFYKKKIKHTDRQPSCALAINNDILSDDFEETKISNIKINSETPIVSKKQYSAFSRIKLSILKSLSRRQNESQNQKFETTKTANHEHQCDSIETHACSSRKPKKKSFCTRNLLNCTGLCILSSNESSVICSDLQLAQLHSLQESRV